ncbi:MAG: AmpG family muropeptide MFS transporter [Gammaproteobacteria bacterium]|nr:AmpG family muropeptide MFS transporter [Gammaproteobacteria bacterium]
MTSTTIDNATESPGWRYYLQKNVLVIFFLGFSSGLPFPLVYSTLSAWLAGAGVELSTVSTFAWLGFAYSFKFVWAPIVDTLRLPVLTRLLGRRRAWMLLAQLSIGVSLFVLSGLDPTQNIEAFALVAAAVALSSATQDIVIDAYRIESAESRMQGVLAAAYQYGYRVAMLVGGAAAMAIAEFAPWSTAYMAMAGCMVIGIATTFSCKEPVSRIKQTFNTGSNAIEKVVHWFAHTVAEPFADFFKRFGRFAIVMLAFISLYRLSDYVLGIIANPFYLDIGYSLLQISVIAKGYGLWVSLVGVGAGGWAVVKFGIARCLVIATILIASTNLFFAVMVIVGPEPWMLAVTISADNLAQGFSGTVLIAYLSSLTNLSFTATQYALLSSFMSLLGKFSAGYSGNVQESIGWLGFFLYAAALGIPAIVLAVIVAKRHDSLVGSD